MEKVLRDAISLLESNTIINGKILKFPTNFALLRYKDEKLSVKHQLILSYLVRAEKLIPNGGKELISTFLEIEKKKDNTFCFQQPNKKQLFEEIIGLGHKQKIVDLCLCAMELAGADGKILIEESNNHETSIELRTGSLFQLQSLLGDCDLIDCKIAIIDGYIESVSEIHHFLNQVNETGDDVLLFIRGCSDDVLSTLSVNLKRGTVRIRPILVKFNEKGINTLKDIAVVSGAKIVSSDLGDLISSVSLNELPRIKRAHISGDKVYLESENREKIIESHFSDLLKKMSNDESDFKFEMFKQRAMCLSNRQVTIRLPNDINFSITKQSLDSCFRHISYTIKNGICEEKNSFKKSLLNNLAVSLKQALESEMIVFN